MLNVIGFLLFWIFCIGCIAFVGWLVIGGR